MNRFFIALAIFLAAMVRPAPVDGAVAVADSVDFSAQIRPVLSARCFQCHGPDESSRKAKLRLDLRDEAMKDRDGSRAIVPGNALESELIKRITSSDPDDVMPPPKVGKPLTAEEISTLKQWVNEGAHYSTHWAFVKPQRPAFPVVQQRRWLKNGIDSFVLEKLEQNHLKPSPQADRYSLLRRLSLDVIGLPPSIEDVDAFVNDSHRDAYERWVDRLLSAPAYGERWARVWLDLARYADSAGYGSDPLRTNIWPWRDWLIDVLNRNLPFDQFTLEVIAGDLLPNVNQVQLIATAFHRNTMTNTEGGTDDEEFRVAAVKDRANTTAQVWMGLTLGCAQCHSHKFDPISQREYYQMFAFFNQTEDTDQPDERPTLPLPTPEQQKKIERVKAQIAELEDKRKKTTPELEEELAAWESAQAKGIEWAPLEIQDAKSAGGAVLQRQPDGSLLASGLSPEKDTYTLKIRAGVTNLTALRLELLPDESLPKNGPGRAPETGKGILSEFQLAVRSPKAETPRARYIRVELSGVRRILSLAEVEIFSGGSNIARDGIASQSSTDSEAGAPRAIDGNTDGHIDQNSITLTRPEDNPWWEIDLVEEKPIEEVALWNRTDSGLGTRLADFKVVAMAADRKKVWDRTVGPAPTPVTYLRLPEEKSAKLQNASASRSEKDYPASKAIDGNSDSKNGWSFGDAPGQPSAISVELNPQTVFEPDSLLIFTIAQKHGTNHTLGRFRLSATSHALPVRELPDEFREIISTTADARTDAQKTKLIDYFREFAPSLAQVNQGLKSLRKQLDEIKPVALPVMRDLALEKHRETRMLHKGNFLDPGDKVEPAVLGQFHAWPENAPANRLGLARWLVSRDNPLTARVAVNRLWARLFGQGLVETEEDFGTQGSLPTHRELLDWLAVEFMENSWDTKAILKTILMSATYQQSARVTPELLEKDPRNRLYSRGARRRLDAEIVRDQSLALSGLLSRKIGGPSVYPPQPDGLWRAAFNGERTWPTSQGEDRFRRGIYTFWRRTVPYPSMATFDAPSREVCTVRRLPTNTPLQAFVTLNDPVFVEAAQALGRRLVREGGQAVADRIRHGLRLCLARPPADEQVKVISELYEKELAHYREHESEALKLATEPLGPLPDGLSAAEAAAWTAVANVLLNLDGVLTN